MNGRLWTTQVPEARAAEHEYITRSGPLPLFCRSPGSRSVAMFCRGEDRAVLTLWPGGARRPLHVLRPGVGDRGP